VVEFWTCNPESAGLTLAWSTASC